MPIHPLESATSLIQPDHYLAKTIQNAHSVAIWEMNWQWVIIPSIEHWQPLNKGYADPS
jgi:hypothetical protein